MLKPLNIGDMVVVTRNTGPRHLDYLIGKVGVITKTVLCEIVKNREGDSQILPISYEVNHEHDFVYMRDELVKIDDLPPEETVVKHKELEEA